MRLARAISALGVVFLLLGGFLLWRGYSADARAGEAARELLSRLPAPNVSHQPEPDVSSPAAPEPDASSADGWDALVGRVLGVLSIPMLDLELPVLDSCTDELLELSVCRYAGSPPTETDGASGFVLAGHSFDSQFGRLPRLRPGDEILFRTLSGQETRYEVEECTKISADPAGLDAEARPLTLFTCTFDGSARFLIRAEPAPP